MVAAPHRIITDALPPPWGTPARQLTGLAAMTKTHTRPPDWVQADKSTRHQAHTASAGQPLLATRSITAQLAAQASALAHDWHQQQKGQHALPSVAPSMPSLPDQPSVASTGLIKHASLGAAMLASLAQPAAYAATQQQQQRPSAESASTSAAGPGQSPFTAAAAFPVLAALDSRSTKQPASAASTSQPAGQAPAQPLHPPPAAQKSQRASKADSLAHAQALVSAMQELSVLKTKLSARPPSLSGSAMASRAASVTGHVGAAGAPSAAATPGTAAATRSPAHSATGFGQHGSTSPLPQPQVPAASLSAVGYAASSGATPGLVTPGLSLSAAVSGQLPSQLPSLTTSRRASKHDSYTAAGNRRTSQQDSTIIGLQHLTGAGAAGLHAPVAGGGSLDGSGRPAGPSPASPVRRTSNRSSYPEPPSDQADSAGSSEAGAVAAAAAEAAPALRSPTKRPPVGRFMSERQLPVVPTLKALVEVLGPSSDASLGPSRSDLKMAAAARLQHQVELEEREAAAREPTPRAGPGGLAAPPAAVAAAAAAASATATASKLQQLAALQAEVARLQAAKGRRGGAAMRITSD